jgi:hypothetical protein
MPATKGCDINIIQKGKKEKKERRKKNIVL